MKLVFITYYESASRHEMKLWTLMTKIKNERERERERKYAQIVREKNL